MTDILIVVDMQRDFVSGVLGSPQAQAIVPAVAERMLRAQNEGTPIVLTLDTHEEDYMDTREGRFLPIPHCIQGTEGWALEPEIGKACCRGMISFEKPTFGSTALMHHVCAAAGAKGCGKGGQTHVAYRRRAVRRGGHCAQRPSVCGKISGGRADRLHRRDGGRVQQPV